jgi:hypothetical protein
MEIDEDDSLETMEVDMDDIEDGSDMNNKEGSTTGSEGSADMNLDTTKPIEG